MWAAWIIQAPQILACVNLILIKSSKDIIQGISKLDCLLKVSALQVYKKGLNSHQLIRSSKSETEQILKDVTTENGGAAKSGKTKRGQTSESLGSPASASTFSINQDVVSTSDYNKAGLGSNMSENSYNMVLVDYEKFKMNEEQR